MFLLEISITIKNKLLPGGIESASIEFGSGRGLPPSSDIYAGGGVSKLRKCFQLISLRQFRTNSKNNPRCITGQIQMMSAQFQRESCTFIVYSADQYLRND